MKLEYFHEKLVYFKEKYGVIWGPCLAVSLKSFQVSSVWMAVYRVCENWSSKFWAAWERLRIVNNDRTLSYKYVLDFEEKYWKISDYRTLNYFEFSHCIAWTSATLTVFVTILICCFAWRTTSTTLSSASSSPRAGNFNWPLGLFKKDGKLQLKKIDEWMKTWWIDIFTFFEMLPKIFVFLFSNNRSISVYCLRTY